MFQTGVFKSNFSVAKFIFLVTKLKFYTLTNIAFDFFYLWVIHYYSVVPKIGSLLFPLKAYTSYPVHLPSMFPLFAENRILKNK